MPQNNAAYLQNINYIQGITDRITERITGHNGM